MQRTWLEWAPKMAAYTKSEYYQYDKTATDMPMFYKPKYVNDDGQKEPYSTEDVLQCAITDAKKNGYDNIPFIKEIVERYDAWMW